MVTVTSNRDAASRVQFVGFVLRTEIARLLQLYTVSLCTQKPAADAFHTQVVVVMAFSSLVRILGECLTIHFPPALFFIVEISSRTLIPLCVSESVHSGSASRGDCGRMFVISCV